MLDIAIAVVLFTIALAIFILKMNTAASNRTVALEQAETYIQAPLN